MHDLLFASAGALDRDDLVRAAARLGLDLERFVDDLDERHFALRVARDVESADDSGAAGTPTFFVNGHRQRGPYDLRTLRDAIEREAGLHRTGLGRG
jgi:protein-disulfide isomerase